VGAGLPANFLSLPGSPITPGEAGSALRLTRTHPGFPHFARSHGLLAHSVRVSYAASQTPPPRGLWLRVSAVPCSRAGPAPTQGPLPYGARSHRQGTRLQTGTFHTGRPTPADQKPTASICANE
jgi:hypothetical protein